MRSQHLDCYPNCVCILCFHEGLEEVAVACETVYKDVSNRLCDLNKRIGTAQKTLTECEQHLVSKQRHLYSVGVDELIKEHSSIFSLFQ